MGTTTSTTNITFTPTPASLQARRLVASCEAIGVCCAPVAVPRAAFGGAAEGTPALRYRLIATKPLFIYEALRASRLPIAWCAPTASAHAHRARRSRPRAPPRRRRRARRRLDVDLEFHAYPSLFDGSAWGPSETHDPGLGRDVLLWNWQGNLSWFGGRRLKAASGVAYFNKTEAAERLLLAWAQAMAYPPNSDAPDDQALDLLVNNDGWIDRAAYGWLPAAYLRMSPHHSAVAPVIDHDRGAPVSGRGRNSPKEPVLPPHALPVPPPIDHSEL